VVSDEGQSNQIIKEKLMVNQNTPDPEKKGMPQRGKFKLVDEEMLGPLPLGGKCAPRKDRIPERKYRFETVPEPIPAKKIKETITAEVLVVGGGISGIGASLSAAEKGAKVILIEKMDNYQARGGCNAYIGSKMQKKLGITIDKEHLLRDLAAYSNDRVDMRLFRLWADNGHETIDWLLDMTEAAGIIPRINQYPESAKYDFSQEYYPSYTCVDHMYDQRAMVECIMNNAKKKGVVMHFKTRAKQLLREGSGRVTGLVAQNEAGEYIRYDATKAVILCTGDFASNAEMVAKYAPHVSYLSGKLTTSTGDGHQMAMWIGARMQRAPGAAMTHGFAGPLSADAFLQVNLKGERFHNEDVGPQNYTNAIESQPNQQAWQVFDAKYPDELKLMGLGFSKVVEFTPELQGYVEDVCQKADTIEELAGKMELPVDTFKATIKTYNELAKLGRDLAFCKRPDRLTTIEKPPFYASKGSYELLVVLGGVNVNLKMQPLDGSDNVIPGLYVAGNVVGNRFSIDYPLTLPGLTHAMALFTGRMAGVNAATLEK
jgi:fumarate reductase flavoprotein subunit